MLPMFHLYLRACMQKNKKKSLARKRKAKKMRVHTREKKLGTSGTFGTKVHEYWVCADFEFVTFVPNVPYFNHQSVYKLANRRFKAQNLRTHHIHFSAAFRDMQSSGLYPHLLSLLRAVAGRAACPTTFHNTSWF